MSQDDDVFDVIVIGGGFAGVSAALRLAEAQRSVLLIERGQYCGAKSFTGGRIYAYALKALLGDDWRKAPVQREVKREIISLLTDEDALNVDTTLTSVSEESYTALSSPLVRWLAERAEEAGAAVIPGVTVTGLLMRDGAVRGVRVGEEEFEARLVIDCEGINPLVFERAGLVRRLDPHDVAVGAKYVFRLGEEEVNRRFTCSSGDGVALMGMGAVTKGVFGGVFLYTNIDSISLGLVVDTEGWKARGQSLLETMEDLRGHPAIGRYIDGGELVEYGAHLVFEGGYDALPRLCGDGWMIAGEAAGLCLNRGFTIRGMDYAIMSGIAAAATAVEALDAGDTGSAVLEGYRERLSTGVLADLKALRRSHRWMAGSPDLFTTYPQVALGFMKDLYHVGDEPLEPVATSLRATAKRVKLLSTARTVLGGMRSM